MPNRSLRCTSVTYKKGAPFDVFSPQGSEEPLPTIVWIDGGAWISGAQSNVEPYLRILAAEGFTTIGIGYPLRPESTYPSAVHHINDALAYIRAHAADLQVDAQRIVLAGDSAGAQLASQTATLTVNAATILHCGVYDLKAMADLAGITAWAAACLDLPGEG